MKSVPDLWSFRRFLFIHTSYRFGGGATGMPSGEDAIDGVVPQTSKGPSIFIESPSYGRDDWI
jgi:hypothetical protein